MGELGSGELFPAKEGRLSGDGVELLRPASVGVGGVLTMTGLGLSPFGGVRGTSTSSFGVLARASLSAEVEEADAGSLAATGRSGNLTDEAASGTSALSFLLPLRQGLRLLRDEGRILGGESR